jgi:hypothetical protein
LSVLALVVGAAPAPAVKPRAPPPEACVIAKPEVKAPPSVLTTTNRLPSPVAKKVAASGSGLLLMIRASAAATASRPSPAATVWVNSEVPSQTRYTSPANGVPESVAQAAVAVVKPTGVSNVAVDATAGT